MTADVIPLRKSQPVLTPIDPEPDSPDTIAIRTTTVALYHLCKTLKLNVSAQVLAETLHEQGLIPLDIRDIDHLGSMADVCTWSRTGFICSDCDCPRKKDSQ